MLTSLRNPLVKQVQKLHRQKGRKEQNLCLLEGTNLLETVSREGYALEVVCCTPAWQEKYPQLWQQAAPLARRVEVVAPEVLARMATTINPDGVIAVISRSALAKTPTSPVKLGIALERLQDPGNLGTIIRTAVATDVGGLWLTPDSVETDNPKVLRASAGAWFHLPMSVSPLEPIIQDFQNRGGVTIATLPQASRTYWEIDFSRPSLILLGNEGAGLSPELAALANDTVSIPVAEPVESLNVGIAAALLLYEAFRQRH